MLTRRRASGLLVAAPFLFISRRSHAQMVPGLSNPSIMSACDGNDTYTKVLLPFDGGNGSTTITDTNRGGSGHAWANNTGSISTAQSKFGGSSYSCAGSGWVDTPDSVDFTLGSAAFTIDMWFYKTGGNGTQYYISGQSDSIGTFANTSHLIKMTTGNVITARVFKNDAGVTFVDVTGTTAFTTTGWNHIALVRTGNTLKLFLNGVQEGGDQTINFTVNDSANKLAVGRLGEFNASIWGGYLDMYRMSVGAARWTSNFVPPTQPYCP